MAAAVLVTAFVLATCVRRIRLDLHPWFPWLVGIVSFVVSFVPFWAIMRCTLIEPLSSLSTRIEFALLAQPRSANSQRNQRNQSILSNRTISL